MFVNRWDVGEFVPIVALSIPIVAIIGGITSAPGVVASGLKCRAIKSSSAEGEDFAMVSAA